MSVNLTNLTLSSAVSAVATPAQQHSPLAILAYVILGYLGLVILLAPKRPIEAQVTPRTKKIEILLTSPEKLIKNLNPSPVLLSSQEMRTVRKVEEFVQYVLNHGKRNGICRHT